MSEGEPDPDSFEEKLRAAAKEVSESVERFAEQFDLDEIADRIGTSGERLRQLADFAGQWLNGQVQDADSQPGGGDADTTGARPGLGGSAEGDGTH